MPKFEQSCTAYSPVRETAAGTEPAANPYSFCRVPEHLDRNLGFGTQGYILNLRSASTALPIVPKGWVFRPQSLRATAVRFGLPSGTRGIPGVG